MALAAGFGVTGAGCNAIDGLKDVPQIVTPGSEGGVGPHRDGGTRDAGNDSGNSGKTDGGHKADGAMGKDGEASHDGSRAPEATATSDAHDACATPCGGVCCSGVCLNNQCQTTLAEKQDPISLAANASDVYWTNAPSFGNPGSVMSVPTVGGTPSTFYTASGASPFALAISSTQVFWSDSVSQDVLAKGFTGNSVNTVYAPEDTSEIGWTCDIALSHGDVFLITQGPEGFLYEGIPADGGSYDVEPFGTTSNPGVQPIAADSEYVYWGSGPSASPGFGGLFRQAIDMPQGQQTTLVSNATVEALVVSGGIVYWVDQNDNSVLSVSTSGGTVTTIASGIDTPVAIAVDATSVYWTTAPCGGPGDCSVGGVYAASLPTKDGGAAGSVITLATGQAQPIALAVTNTAIYWANAGNDVDAGVNTGTIMQLTPKP